MNKVTIALSVIIATLVNNNGQVSALHYYGVKKDEMPDLQVKNMF